MPHSLYLRLNMRKYIEIHTLYNDILPMFSYLVDAILYERYAKYLMAEIERIELTEVQTDRSRSSVLVNDELCEQKKKPVIVGKGTNPFQSDFTEEQIEILTTCINENPIIHDLHISQDTQRLFRL